MTPPIVTAYLDTSKGVWRANIYFPDTKRRLRPFLGVPADQDPTERLAAYKTEMLPAVIAQHQADLRAAQAAEEAKPTNGAGATLRSLADWFLDTHLPYQNRADKTLDHYQRQLDRFIAFCSSRHVARAQQLSGRIIQEWQLQSAKDRNRQGPSRDEVLAIKHWLDTCTEFGELKEILDIKWSVPSKTKSKRFKAYPTAIVSAWVQALYRHRPRAAAVAEWVAATGWRIGDALDLRVGEIHLDRNCIDRHQIKTSEGLPYPLTPALHQMVQSALQGRPKPDPDEHLFLDHKSRPWDYQQIVKLIDYFHKSKRWDGPAINFRDLRKSFGSSLAMQGCPPNVLKELMGHSSIEMTLGYYVTVDLAKMDEWSQRHAPLKPRPTQPPGVSPATEDQ